MTEEIKQLTVKEAIEQGYTNWGHDSKDGGFQRLGEVKDFTNSDFKDAVNYGYGDPVLAQKEPYYMSIDAEQLQELVADQIMSRDDFKDDDLNTIPDALKEIDGWEEFAAKINDKMKELPYWYLTEIKLLP
jgi:hypothetical protein